MRLPWIVSHIPAGHRIAVTVSTTDFSYALPSAPGSYQVGAGRLASAVACPRCRHADRAGAPTAG